VAEGLTLEQLARYTGEPVERLEDWRSRGLICPDCETPEYRDLERVRLVQLCLRRGISLDAIVDANRSQRMIDRYVEMLPEPTTRTYSVAEAAEITGIDLDVAQTLWRNAGLATQQGEAMREEDLDAFRAFKGYFDAGFPLEALAEGTRVFADSLARVAEMESKIFHFYVHERLKSQGLTGDDLLKATDAAGEIARPLLEPTILWFHSKAWEKSVREDLVMHMAEEAGLTPPSEAPGELRLAVMFVDLASFTPLTEAMGDIQAAQVLERFSAIVREATDAWNGRLVKQIGDAFMLVFPDARSAVACALEIESSTAKEPQFPAVRAGIHWGTLLYREGDYVGSNVNIASRLANEAGRHQVLVTAEVRKEARDLPEIEFARLGKRQLKGLSGKIELFEVHSSAAPAAEKAIDPVCGMELGPGEVAARLSLEGAERAFCSEECLRKFVVSPEQYAKAGE
jgi:class 3 adenylate cyclase/YHS domain-containing protein